MFLIDIFKPHVRPIHPISHRTFLLVSVLPANLFFQMAKWRQFDSARETGNRTHLAAVAAKGTKGGGRDEFALTMLLNKHYRKRDAFTLAQL